MKLVYIYIYIYIYMYRINISMHLDALENKYNASFEIKHYVIETYGGKGGQTSRIRLGSRVRSVFS